MDGLSCLLWETVSDQIRGKREEHSRRDGQEMDDLLPGMKKAVFSFPATNEDWLIHGQGLAQVAGEIGIISPGQTDPVGQQLQGQNTEQGNNRSPQ